MHKKLINLIKNEKTLLNDKNIADTFKKYLCSIVQGLSILD